MENLDKIMNPRKKIPNKQNLQDLELARGYAQCCMYMFLAEENLVDFF